MLMMGSDKKDLIEVFRFKLMSKHKARPEPTTNYGPKSEPICFIGLLTEGSTVLNLGRWESDPKVGNDSNEIKAQKLDGPMG